MKPESDAVDAQDQSKASGTKESNASGIRVLQPLTRCEVLMTMAKAMANLNQTIDELMQLTDLVIESENDGDGIPYADQPEGVYNAPEGEDEFERMRR